MPSTNHTAPSPLPLPFTPIAQCIASFARGNFLIVLDSPSRENEGDLIIAARALTPSKAAFMIRHTSGYLCAPLPACRARELALHPMVREGENTDPNRTAYTISVDASDEGAEKVVGRGRGGITTGISARDRSVTARVLADPKSGRGDLRRPGHVVPLIARDGGVRERKGHTEACVEFARLAGWEESERVGVIGEVVEEVEEEDEEGEEDGREDGVVVLNGDAKGKKVTREGEGSRRRIPEYPAAIGMMRTEGCLRFGRKWGIDVCTIEDLVKYVEEREGKLEV